MRGTKVESYALPAHDWIESGLENLISVMLLLSELEARLAHVEVMSLETFKMLDGEATELKKTQREILARLIGVKEGLGEFSNQAMALENRVERYQQSIQQILEPGRSQIVLKIEEQETKIENIAKVEVGGVQHRGDPIPPINLLPLEK